MGKQLEVPIRSVDGRYTIAGTRIPVDSIVEAHHLSMSPPQIADAFPPLTVATVYSLLAWYHANRRRPSSPRTC